MALNNAELLARLRETFRAEAEEHLRVLSSGLLELEAAVEAERRAEVLSTIYREVHTLKGAAGAVEHSQIERVCQSMESVFAMWRKSTAAPEAVSLDALHRAVDLIGDILSTGAIESVAIQSIDRMEAMLRELVSTVGAPVVIGDRALNPVESHEGAETAPVESIELQRAESVVQATNGQTSTVIRSSAASPERVIRVSSRCLDGLVLKLEELQVLKLSLNQRLKTLRIIAKQLSEWDRRSSNATASTSTRGRNERVESRIRGPEAHITQVESWTTGDGAGNNGQTLNREDLRALSRSIHELTRSLEHDQRATNGMVDLLLEDARQLLLQPCSTIFELIPKLVRDLSRSRSKEVGLSIKGGEIEIDKRILDELREVLVHLIRNCIDHGIEEADDRRKSAKGVRATISIAASYLEGDRIEVKVSDDGAGIDLERLRSKALSLAAVSSADLDAMSECELASLVFLPDISTSSTITEISGRGLGLAIVKEKIEKLGGRVSVETRPGTGTTFRLQLPLKLSTFRGIFVQVADAVFVVPTAGVERVLRIDANSIHHVENREVIRIDDRPVSLMRLDDVLGVTGASSRSAARHVLLLLNDGRRRIAFVVDDVLEEREIIVKALSRPLVRVRNFAGATVIGTGKAIPVLNVADLLESSQVRVERGASISEQRSLESIPAQTSILVADDSITSRMLLKSILEAAGFTVSTAVDGADALKQLESRRFSVLVSDVEMPHLNGFELTAQIRSSEKNRDLPVVLVTALASREDRERGMAVGANSYIVKSKFDQSDLLAVIKRVI